MKSTRIFDLRRLKVFVLIALIACDNAQRADSRVSTGNSISGHSPQVVDTPRLPSEIGAIDVVRRYYDAIQQRQYGIAYALWDGGGEASGQTQAGFAARFAEIDHAKVTIGGTVDAGAAAGSQFVTVPVKIDVVLRSGVHRRFFGAYTLARAIADGATPEQQSWHIFSVKLRQVTEYGLH